MLSNSLTSCGRYKSFNSIEWIQPDRVTPSVEVTRTFNSIEWILIKSIAPRAYDSHLLSIPLNGFYVHVDNLYSYRYPIFQFH